MSDTLRALRLHGANRHAGRAATSRAVARIQFVRTVHAFQCAIGTRRCSECTRPMNGRHKAGCGWRDGAGRTVTEQRLATLEGLVS